jgi:hypothetical protein
LRKVGWSGAIPREEALERLSNRDPGTFLLRYSPNRRSFVISFVHASHEVRHIEGIWIKDGRVTVMQGDTTMKVYDSILAFIESQSSFLTHPVTEISKPCPFLEYPERNYSFSNMIYVG